MVRSEADANSKQTGHLTELLRLVCDGLNLPRRLATLCRRNQMDGAVRRLPLLEVCSIQEMGALDGPPKRVTRTQKLTTCIGGR
jgi:hypothetical protein